MPSGSNFIERLQQIVSSQNVLTQVEDLYVYSFERFFLGERLANLAAVVRTRDGDKIRKVEELTKEMGLSVKRRSDWAQRFKELNSTKAVLLDDVKQPQLEPSIEDVGKQDSSELQKELERSGHGSFRNFAIGLKSFFSRLPSKQCLECEVCSGYCTVSSSFNGIETWSSKGRTLITRALSRDELQLSPKLIDILYTCSLCGLCFAQCFETTQVRKAIMEARHQLAEKKAVPELFAATAKSIFDVGDPSGMPMSKRVAWSEQPLGKTSFSKKADVLFWAGCVVSTRTPNAAKALARLLNRAKVDFAYLGEKEGCCGYVLVAAGLWKEARENAAGVVERIRKVKAEALVTPCAGCYYTFTRLYPEVLSVELPLNVFHASQYVEHVLNERRIALGNLDWRITYHDPCSLGRHSNIFDSPRTVLKSVPDLDLVEMRPNRKRARCCGAGGGLWSFKNSVALNSAAERLVNDVTPLNVSALITACPTCSLNFRYASIKKSSTIQVYDIMEVVDKAASKLPLT